MTHLECTRCGASHSPAPPLNVCQCGGILYPRYDLAALRASWSRSALAAEPPTLWRYHRILPVREPANRIGLGEGLTPMIPAIRRGPFRDYASLCIKDEGPIPTQSDA